MNNDLSSDVQRLYANCSDRPSPLNEEYAVQAGLVVERLFPPDSTADTFRILVALNLLNAAVKQPWGPGVVTYGYIKGMAACLLLHLLAHPVSGVSVYWDCTDSVAYFSVWGVQVSFHYIPLYRDLTKLLSETYLVPQRWSGLQLQKIACELFTLAVSEPVVYDAHEENYVRYVMRHYKRLAREVDAARPHTVKKTCDGVDAPLSPSPFIEDKMQALDVALHFNIWRQNVFTLWRRKDDKALPVVRYDGTNYNMVMSYILGNNRFIRRRSRHSMRLGRLYYLSPQKRICCISRSRYILLLTQNNYLRLHDSYCNLCITYGIARYLALMYPKLKFVCTLNYNRMREQHVFYTYIELCRVPVLSPARQLKVWLVVDTKNLLCNFDVNTLPQALVDDYMTTEDFYQEFEIVSGGDGRKGIMAYRQCQLLPPVYRDIVISNYHARVMGDNGLWAVYSLGSECFRSDFVYTSLWYDRDTASIKGKKNGHTVVIYDFRQSHRNERLPLYTTFNFGEWF